MDDFTIASLQESKNEWCARLVNIMTPLMIEGVQSIFDEALKLCLENDEQEKYLMTFQNLISRIPKWNANIIEAECKRILERSGCTYLEDLISCVHIVQLKVLTCVRVGTKQKKIDINIPKLDDFIHKAYVHVARKIYSNVYLYERNVSPLQRQKHKREMEVIVQECIMNTIRESLPIEHILRTYIDETAEEDVTQEIVEEKLEVPAENSNDANGEEEKKTTEVPVTDSPEEIKDSAEAAESTETEAGGLVMKVDTSSDEHVENAKSLSSISFNNTDEAISSENIKTTIDAPKDVDTLEKLNAERREREMEEDDDDEDNGMSLGRLELVENDNVLDELDIHDLTPPPTIEEDPLDDIMEILE
jgi:hypothetical protein